MGFTMNVRAHPAPSRETGFTLVEVIIAVVLIGVLAGVIILGIGRMTDNAASASCAASADATWTASRSFLVDNARYPTSFVELSVAAGAVPARLVVPPDASVSASQIVVGSWTLAMSSSSPPTFTCTSSSAISTTISPTMLTTAALTTTTSIGNGVSVVPSTSGYQRYFGANVLTVSNSSNIAAMSISVTIVRTPEVTYHDQYTNLWGGVAASGHTTSSGAIRYTTDLGSGLVIVPGSWTIEGTFYATGTLHPSAGDTWTITTASAGITSTLSGTF